MTTPSPALPDPARSRAVLIAVSHYLDDGLADYPALAAGAHSLAALFRDPTVWGLPEQHCTVLTKAADTTQTAILDAVEAAAKEAEDALVVYFAGHGVTWAGQYYLADSGARPGDCVRWLSWKVLRSRLADNLTRASLRIAILDACESGAAIGEGPHEGDAALLASCAGTERAWVPPGDRYSRYTGTLIDVLGGGDARQETVFTPSSLHKAVKSRLPDIGQKPGFQHREEGGSRTWLFNRAGQSSMDRSRAIIANVSEPDSAVQTEAFIEPEPVPEKPLHANPTPGGKDQWRARRVRTGGIDFILQVSNGADQHLVEYRSLDRHRAKIRLDGQQIYRGLVYGDISFRLGRRHVRARLKLTGNDVQLWVEKQQVYSLGKARPGSEDFLEERAAAIRAKLLETWSYRSRHRTSSLVLSVAPDISIATTRSVRTRRRGGASLGLDGSLIGVLSTSDGQRFWFTDRALHIRTTYETVIDYETLAEAVVEAEDDVRIRVGGEEFTMKQPDEVAWLVNAVKATLVHQVTGEGHPPRIQEFSGARASYAICGKGITGRWWLTITGLLTALVAAQGVSLGGNLDVWWPLVVPLIAGVIGGGMSTGMLAILAGVMRRGPSLGRAILLTAVFTAIVSMFITWRFGAPLRSGASGDVHAGWLIPLTKNLAMAIGDPPEVASLGLWPQLLGALATATAAFLAVTLAPMIHHRRMQRQRLH